MTRSRHSSFLVFFRSLALICAGHRASRSRTWHLRQQLAVFKRTIKRPSLRDRDRLLWMAFTNAWRDWRTALIVVKPDTVVRWHRQWLRRRWTRRSTHARVGRPGTNAAIRQFCRADGRGESSVIDRTLTEAEISLTQPLECRAIRAHNISVDRFRRGHEPRVVLAHPSCCAALQ